jgi:hypothetical protein
MKNVWMKGLAALALLAVLGAAQLLRADMDAKKCATAPKMPVEFKKLKGLVGTWKGTAQKGEGKPMETTNRFELTSGGTAILEKIGDGADHQMISVYCAENGKLVMTHYCTVGNQPKMSLVKSTDKSLVFAMKGTDGISSAKDMHMHAMTITWKDADHITEDWSMYVDGKSQGGCPFELTRVK